MQRSAAYVRQKEALRSSSQLARPGACIYMHVYTCMCMCLVRVQRKHMYHNNLLPLNVSRGRNPYFDTCYTIEYGRYRRPCMHVYRKYNIYAVRKDMYNLLVGSGL